MVAAVEQLGIAGDHAERLLEIVAGDVCELFELAVAAAELFALMGERFFAFLESGYVSDDSDVAVDLAGFSADRGGAAGDAGGVCACGAEAEFGVPLFAGHRGLFPGGGDLVLVVGMYRGKPAVAFRLPGIDGGHVGPAGVDVGASAFGVALEDSNRRVSGENAEAALAGAEGGFGHFA